MKMQLDLVVEERHDNIDVAKGTVTLKSADPRLEYEGYWVLKNGWDPAVRELRLGQRLRVTVEVVREAGEGPHVVDTRTPATESVPC